MNWTSMRSSCCFILFPGNSKGFPFSETDGWVGPFVAIRINIVERTKFGCGRNSWGKDLRDADSFSKAEWACSFVESGGDIEGLSILIVTFGLWKSGIFVEAMERGRVSKGGGWFVPLGDWFGHRYLIVAYVSFIGRYDLGLNFSSTA